VPFEQQQNPAPRGVGEGGHAIEQLGRMMYHYIRI
jgi:hypothetical protein